MKIKIYGYSLLFLGLFSILSAHTCPTSYAFELLEEGASVIPHEHNFIQTV